MSKGATRSTMAVAATILASMIVAGCSSESVNSGAGRRTRTALCVTGEQANAHALPSADSEIVAQLMVASNVWGDTMTGDWWRIEHKDQRVWLHKSLVDTGHLPQALVVHRQAGALEGVLQRRAAELESDLEEIRTKALGGE